jgi:hypothetical protein
MLPPSLDLPIFALALLLPLLLAVAIVLVPPRRRQVGGIIVGNPLKACPVAPLGEVESHPYTHLCRVLSGRDMEGYILGMRHLPVEKTVPVLARYVTGTDPALQLYAQAVLQQGKDDLQQQFQRLVDIQGRDPRQDAWLLETGLRLASTSLNSASERQSWLDRLTSLARGSLASIQPPLPSLVAAAARVFNEAGLPRDAASLVETLPDGSPLRLRLTQETAHLLQQRAVATH